MATHLPLGQQMNGDQEYWTGKINTSLMFMWAQPKFSWDSISKWVDSEIHILYLVLSKQDLHIMNQNHAFGSGKETAVKQYVEWIRKAQRKLFIRETRWAKNEIPAPEFFHLGNCYCLEP